MFCHGQLLDTIQQSGIYPDSKTFVDMHMLMNPETVLKDFDELMKQGQPTVEAIRSFVQDHFDGPGGELEVWIPEDWSEKYETWLHVFLCETLYWPSNSSCVKGLFILHHPMRLFK